MSNDDCVMQSARAGSLSAGSSRAMVDCRCCRYPSEPIDQSESKDAEEI